MKFCFRPLLLPLFTATTNSFYFPPPPRPSFFQLPSTKIVNTNESPKISPTESNFWFSTPETPPSNKTIIPHTPFLDLDGPLPSESYRSLGDDLKTCLLSVAICIPKNEDPDNVLKGMHKFVDGGFNTFASSGQSEEENLFGLFKKETPLSVVNQCHFLTKMDVPTQEFGNGMSVKKTVSEKLLRMGGDYLDSFQLLYNPNSPYHLDTLDILMDLQREGTIRSISTIKFPPSLLQSAFEFEFTVDSNQVPYNIFHSNSRLLKELKPICTESNLKLMTNSPLAGGLLHEKFINVRKEELQKMMSPREQQHFSALFSEFSNDALFWEWFLSSMSVSNEISFKHQVSISNIALRYALQELTDYLGSVVVASEVGKMAHKEEVGYDRVSDLRKVFTFELDEEDMEKLREVGQWNEKDRGEEEEEEEGFDLSDRRLWL